MEIYERLEKELLYQPWMDAGGVRDVVVCNSGTAALHLALEAMKLPPRSEVLIPTYCMGAVAAAVRMAGLTPVFADCDPHNYGIVAPAWNIARNCKACIVVHNYGRMVDVGQLRSKLPGNIRIVEDMAEAHGVPKHIETDFATYSFYKNKLISGEEGGAVAIGERPWVGEAGQLLRSLRCMGFFSSDHQYLHTTPRGCNYRLADSLAGLILNSLYGMIEKREYWKRMIETEYIPAHLSRHVRMEADRPARAAYWVKDIEFNIDSTREVVCSSLRTAKIPFRKGFIPLHLQPEFISYSGDLDEFPVAFDLSCRVLYLSPDHINSGMETIVRTVERLV